MSITVLGLFEHVDELATTVRPLEEMRVTQEDIKLLSVAPYPDGTLYHDRFEFPMWRNALIGGVIGFIAALALAGGTQVLMNLNVGGKPPFSVPPVAVICYEFALLGAVLATFISMLWWCHLPDWNELAYDTEISRSKIGLLVRCRDDETADKVEAVMKSRGAKKIKKGRDDF